MNSKIKSVASVLKIAKELKSNKKTIGFTNGCFDILHRGHIDYLKRAKRYVDILVVGLNSDNSIKKIKGDTRPLVKQSDRAAVLSGLEAVDYVVVFNEETPYKLIEKIKPDYLFKGSDWQKSKVVGAGILKSYGGKVVLMHYVSGYSTTGLIKKIWKKKFIG